jgi:uncharacterized repeat protein (TIGR01451 family)
VIDVKRRGITRVLMAACCLLSTLGVSVFVSHGSGPAVVALAGWSGPSYARDVAGFQPVTALLLKDLTKPRVRPAPAKPAPAPQPPGAATRASTPDTGHVPVPTSPPNPGPPPPPPAPSLAVEITADHERARPNETIVYTIQVTNTGPVSAAGLVIESHVPDGTSLSGWTCDGDDVKAHGADSFSCGDLGAAPAPNHPLVFTAAALAPGGWIVERFWVRIDHNVNHNTVIIDHAHAYAANADLADSDMVSVIVR